MCLLNHWMLCFLKMDMQYCDIFCCLRLVHKIMTPIFDLTFPSNNLKDAPIVVIALKKILKDIHAVCGVPRVTNSYYHIKTISKFGQVCLRPHFGRKL